MPNIYIYIYNETKDLIMETIFPLHPCALFEIPVIEKSVAKPRHGIDQSLLRIFYTFNMAKHVHFSTIIYQIQHRLASQVFRAERPICVKHYLLRAPLLKMTRMVLANISSAPDSKTAKSLVMFQRAPHISPLLTHACNYNERDCH